MHVALPEAARSGKVYLARQPEWLRRASVGGATRLSPGRDRLAQSTLDTAAFESGLTACTALFLLVFQRAAWELSGMDDAASEIARLRAALAESEARAASTEADLAQVRAVVTTSEAVIRHRWNCSLRNSRQMPPKTRSRRDALRRGSQVSAPSTHPQAVSRSPAARTADH